MIFMLLLITCLGLSRNQSISKSNGLSTGRSTTVAHRSTLKAATMTLLFLAWIGRTGKGKLSIETGTVIKHSNRLFNQAQILVRAVCGKNHQPTMRKAQRVDMSHVANF